MKRLIPLLVLPLIGGCVNTSKLVRALSKDPASVHLSVKSIYANVDLTRVNPVANTPAYAVLPDGTISVRPNIPQAGPPVNDDNVREAIKRIPIPVQ